MKIEKVLIIYKKSAYQTYFREYKPPHFTKLARAGDKVLAHIKRSHKVHYSSLEFVQTVLKKHGIRYDHLHRGRLFNENGYDLVISLGGDGTFLDAARNVREKFILGVNSDTNHSVGKFCHAYKGNFEKVLSLIRRRQFKVRKINRMEIAVNDKKFPKPILNDVLICHACPAAMSHYTLEIQGRRETQRGSGLWVSTAVGSTGATKSAGGKILPLGSARFQYLPRELYRGHGVHHRLKGGFVPKDLNFFVYSLMQEGIIYMDGAHHNLSFRYGDKISFSKAKYPLNMVYFGSGDFATDLR